MPDNLALARRLLDAWNQGDVAAVLALVTPQTALGRVAAAPEPGPSSWRCRSRTRLLPTVLGFFAKTMELSGGTFRMEVHDVMANDDHAVALCGQLCSGRVGAQRVHQYGILRPMSDKER